MNERIMIYSETNHSTSARALPCGEIVATQWKQGFDLI